MAVVEEVGQNDLAIGPGIGAGRGGALGPTMASSTEIAGQVKILGFGPTTSSSTETATQVRIPGTVSGPGPTIIKPN